MRSVSSPRAARWRTGAGGLTVGAAGLQRVRQAVVRNAIDLGGELAAHSGASRLFAAPWSSSV